MADLPSNDFLGTENIGKLLFRLSVPSVIAQLVNVLYNMVDRMYIGHIPSVGRAALTGVGVCFPIIMLISAFTALTAMGGASLASIHMGKNDKATAEKIMGNSFSALVVVSVILTAVFSLFHRPLLFIFGASENTVEYASSYISIYVLGTIFVQLALGMNAFITAQGFSTISMMSVLIGAVLNTVLDPIFIFALNLGVRGAALATVISQCASAVWVISFLCGKKCTIRLRASNMRISPKVLMPSMALGLSPFIMQSTESVLSLCFNSSLLKYGGDIAVGAMTILSSVMQFAMLPLQGLTQGAQPITGYNYGAGNIKRVKKTFFLLLTVCLSYSVLLWGISMLFPSQIASLFTSDRLLIEFSARALRIYMATSLLFGIQISCQQTFISLGNAKTSMFLAIFRKIILLIPLIYILPLFMADKTFAVYTAEPVADLVAVSVTAIMFSRQFKKLEK